MSEPLNRKSPPSVLHGDRPPHPGRKLSWEEFLDWYREDARAEWVDGEVVFMPSSVHRRHDKLVRFLHTVIGTFVQLQALGEVRGPEFFMYLETHPSGRAPDLFFVRTEHLDRLEPGSLEGPADLAVEVVSDESIGRDRGEKLVEYEEAGVPEYWVLDPKRRRAEFHRLGPEGRYETAEPGPDGWYESVQIEGLKLRVDWLWQEPPPDLLSVLRELGLLAER